MKVRLTVWLEPEDDEGVGHMSVANSIDLGRVPLAKVGRLIEAVAATGEKLIELTWGESEG